jgi:oligopeptidase B
MVNVIVCSRIGQPEGQEDVVVFEEKDEAFYVHIGRSHSEQLLYISCGSAVTNETRYLAADTPEGDFQVILPRQQDVEYDVSHHPGTKSSSSSGSSGSKAGGWLVITLRDKERPNSEVLVAPLANPQQQEVGGWLGKG